MPFMKYANARVVQPHVTKTEWRKVRTAAKVAASDGDLSDNLIQRASDFFGSTFDPTRYLLTHATIVASVDTYSPPGTKTGSVVVDGFRVNRKYSNYRIKPETDPYINNNLDAWDRPVLMKSFRTFIGGHNFVEHVQVEELSKGRIIDAVARDIGDSVYIDILIATDRKHKDLVAAIESGKMGTLSMGCFVPGTQITMSDGRRIAIEDVQPGDMVLTHKGRSREVLNKQIRIGSWDMRRISVVGIPSKIESTNNHPFFVYRPARLCACGCGEEINPHGTASRRMGVRLKMGHQMRVFNPNNTYSIDEARKRKQVLQDMKGLVLEEVRADELQVGDYLCFPRAEVQDMSSEATIGKSRLIGYFLAEGSFIKRKGKPVEIQFNFSLKEKNTYVEEVVELLRHEFPEANSPWVQEREDRTTCTVHCTGRSMVKWFHSHCGEYANHKRMSPEVMNWPIECHKHIIGTWINGDGWVSTHNGGTSCSTTSYDLVCQMHMLMARCGILARMSCNAGEVETDLHQIVNGGFVRNAETHRLPSFTLTVGQALIHKELSGYTDKVSSSSYGKLVCKVEKDTVMLPIKAIESVSYNGDVYDMEVDEDHSYVADGVAVHNCTVDGTRCTKCGNWAADETEMCPCIKYAKGNTFFDEQGKQHRIAELCGHESLDPTGGVQFIEASWVEAPAFTGAVLRNVLNFTTETAKKAKAVLSSPPPEWDRDAMKRAAGHVTRRVGSPAVYPRQLVSGAEDAFLAGWLDEGGGEPGGDAEGGGEPGAPMEPAAEPAAEPASPFKDVEDAVYESIKNRVRDRLQKDVAPPTEGAMPVSTNETLNKQGRNDAAFLDRIAAYNNRVGIDIPVEIYRTTLKVGAFDRYANAGSFLQACHKALGRKVSLDEAKALVRLGKLLSRGPTSGGR